MESVEEELQHRCSAFEHCVTEFIQSGEALEVMRKQVWSVNASLTIFRTAAASRASPWRGVTCCRTGSLAVVASGAVKFGCSRGGSSGESVDTIGGTLEEGTGPVGRRDGFGTSSLRAVKRRSDSSLALCCTRRDISRSVSGVARSSGFVALPVWEPLVVGKLLLVGIAQTESGITPGGQVEHSFEWKQFPNGHKLQGSNESVDEFEREAR